jgi:TolA-binding protein
MPDDSLKGRVTRQGEEAIGRLAQELLENPIVSGALTRAFETRERATRAQELAMGALNLPSAGDLERLTRRVRSVSQRLESIEDGLDRLEGRLSRSGSEQRLDERLEKIEALLERLESERANPSPAPARRAGSKQARPAKASTAAPRPPARSRPKRSGPAAG